MILFNIEKLIEGKILIIIKNKKKKNYFKKENIIN
jgi:hypothetical protein